MALKLLLPALLLGFLSCAAGAPAAPPSPPQPPPPAPAKRAPPEMIVVRPKEIDEVLVNPGMGIQTFQRFGGQALNPGLTWSEEGPVDVLADAKVKPDFPGSSLAYLRWFWSQIEPSPGVYRWEILDRALAEARAHHQTLAVRLMPYDPQHPLPSWYRSSGARRANKPSDPDGAIWQPDFADPIYLRRWGELVARAGERYDGHPYLDTVDISSIGYWGEGWSLYMPAFSHQQALIDVWLGAFKQTPLLMNFDEPTALAYGTGHGAGFRLDCLGDLRVTEAWPAGWSHMRELYPQQIARTGIQDVWKHCPVSLETCWVPGHWKAEGWDVDAILAQALRWHLSSLNVKSSAIPPEWIPRFDAFQKKMGYRFVLRRLSYPRAIEAGRMMPVHMWWFNAGVAPVYRPYDLMIELRSAGVAAAIRVPVDVRTFLPDDAVFDGTLFVPEDLAPGAYRFRIALLDPRTREPAIRLAIEGRQPDGWYDLGEIRVE